MKKFIKENKNLLLSIFLTASLGVNFMQYQGTRFNIKRAKNLEKKLILAQEEEEKWRKTNQRNSTDCLNKMMIMGVHLNNCRANYAALQTTKCR